MGSSNVESWHWASRRHFSYCVKRSSSTIAELNQNSKLPCKAKLPYSPLCDIKLMAEPNPGGSSKLRRRSVRPRNRLGTSERYTRGAVREKGPRRSTQMWRAHVKSDHEGTSVICSPLQTEPSKQVTNFASSTTWREPGDLLQRIDDKECCAIS